MLEVLSTTASVHRMSTGQDPENDLLEGLHQQTRRSRGGVDEAIPPTLGITPDDEVEANPPGASLDLEPSNDALKRGASRGSTAGNGSGDNRDVFGDLVQSFRAQDPRRQAGIVAGLIAAVVVIVVLATSGGNDSGSSTKTTASATSQTSTAAAAPTPATSQTGTKIDRATGLPEDLQPRGIEVFADQRLAGAGNGTPVPDRLVMFLPKVSGVRESGVVVQRISHRTKATVRAGSAVDVEGEALRGAQPASKSLVTVVAKEGGQTAQIVARSRTDNLGRFRLSVPVGRRKTELVAYLFTDRNARTAILSGRLDVTAKAARKARRGR